MGNGGAARAVVFALIEKFGVKQVVILGRDENKLNQVSAWAEALASKVEITTTLMSEPAGEIDSFDVVVNTTPLGGWHQPEISPKPKWLDWSRVKLYYDLNYNDDNPVVQAATAAGVETLDGQPMLVAQAVRSFNLWTGSDVDPAVIITKVIG